jgi:hypothetical protein
MCSDEVSHVEIDKLLARAVDAAKDLEEENARLRDALDEDERAAAERYGFGVCVTGTCFEPCGDFGGCKR